MSLSLVFTVVLTILLGAPLFAHAQHRETVIRTAFPGYLQIRDSESVILEGACVILFHSLLAPMDTCLLDIDPTAIQEGISKCRENRQPPRHVTFSAIVELNQLDQIRLNPLVDLWIIVFDKWEPVENLTLVPQNIPLVMMEGTLVRKILKEPRQDTLSVSLSSYIDTGGNKYKIITCLLLFICAISGILIGSLMVFLDQDQMLKDMENRRVALQKLSKLTYLYLGLLVVISITCLVMLYFFYDIMIYFLIAIFSICAVWSIVRILSFFTKYLIPAARKTFPVNCLKSLFPEREISVTSLCYLPVGLAIVITWFIFRNNPEIGWPIQSILGISLIASLLSSGSMLPSLKLTTILYSFFLIYDVVFVFISPHFVPKTSTPKHEPSASEVVRIRRGDSFMEAVASGTAGKSGELIPIVFRILIKEYIPISIDHVEILPHGSLLGFGDALIPGLLSVFLALYDASWKIPAYRHFWSSIIGYTIGMIVTYIVMFCTGGGQPALLYLCPCSLLSVVVTALCFGGVTELKCLWVGIFPSAPEESVVSYEAPNSNTGDDLFYQDKLPIVLTEADFTRNNEKAL